MIYDYLHCIMTINEHVEIDPIMLDSMKRIFVWANEMGLKGKKVYSLEIKKNWMDRIPFFPKTFIECHIDYIEEERKKWEELQKLNVGQAINDVKGREEHEAILRDPKKCEELGIDRIYECMVYLKRWGGWLP